MPTKSSGHGASRKSTGPNQVHVVPSENGWAVRRPHVNGPVPEYRTQRTAIDAGRAQLRPVGGEVKIHGRNGRIRDSDTVAPGHDPYPPKDKR